MSKEIKRNLVIVIIIAVVIGGYAFFFLSPRIFRESKDNLLNTEFGKEERHQAPHGPEFWMIYGQLMNRAKALGLFTSPVLPILEIPAS